MKEVKIKEIAYLRASEKGDAWSLPLIPYRGDDYSLLKEKTDTEFIASTFEELLGEHSKVRLYEFEGAKVLNYVMFNSIDGGASRTLAKNMMWRSREEPLLEATIEVPDEYEPPKVADGSKEWER